MKVVVIVSILFLVVLCLFVRKDFSLLMMAAAVTLDLIGFWDIKDDVLSDIPFIFFLLVFVIKKYSNESRTAQFSSGIRWCTFVSFIWYRSAGIVLIPAFWSIYSIAQSPHSLTAAIFIWLLSRTAHSRSGKLSGTAQISATDGLLTCSIL
jgi:hypothetical protein